MPITPNENDVLFGRGTAVSDHPGNRRFRALCESRRDAFQNAPNRKTKRALAAAVFDEVASPGGRFLAEAARGGDDGGSSDEEGGATTELHPRLAEKAWAEVEKDRALAKIKHRLRERADATGDEEEDDEASGERPPPSPAPSSIGEVSIPRGGDVLPWHELGRPDEATNNADEPLHSFGVGWGMPTNFGTAPSADPPADGRSCGLQDLLGRGHSARATGVRIDLASAPDPMGLREWTEAAHRLSSTGAYLAGAVELALRIAEGVQDFVGSIFVADISAETMRIVVEHQPRADGLPSIRHVNFPLSATRRPTLEPREACATLGEMLAVVFGIDRFDAREETVLPRQPNDAVGGMPPSQKRQATGPANSALATSVELPLSIHRLVRDLLGARSEPPSSSALVSLDEALWELAQMRNNPQSFLFDQTSPEKAKERFHGVDDCLVGRGKELGVLVEAKKRVSTFVVDSSSPSIGQGNGFLCEAVFLSGYAGSGKTSLLLPLMHDCKEERWFVLSCKFDKLSSPVQVVFRAFNDFFAKYSGGTGEDASDSMIKSFRQVCDRIGSTVDNEGFAQLSELVPNFAKLFPSPTGRTINPSEGAVSSMDKVGTAQHQLTHLIHILLESICSAGRPVLLTVDDMQWSDSFVVESMVDFFTNRMQKESPGKSCRRGLLLAGAYRNNEVKGGDPLFQMDTLFQSINAIKLSKNVNVTTLDVDELTQNDITELISAKLGLPSRYTRDLAAVVHSKTRGNPFFVVQFLRTIVSNNMLQFSVRSRRWLWECDVVDLLTISEGVAGLLAATFDQLPSQLMQTMQVISCFGYQVVRATIHALDATQKVLPFCMLDQMELAIREGILEKAGPVYQFTHDILQQTIYDSIHPNSRSLLHKSIGKHLLDAAANNPSIHMLAVDQINLFCREGTPSSEERALFASSNAKAAKFALSSYSFKQARSYIDTGITLLEPNHWETQYALSLSLFEMSASVSCITGDTTTMHSRLQEVLAHVLTFEDSLKGASLLVKLLASNSQFDDARFNCFDILKHLGETFPQEINASTVQNELPAIRSMLTNVSYEQMKALPQMTDRTKLNAMTFLNLLCMCSNMSKPLLLPILSSRMLKLTLQHGLCADGIVGLALAGHSMFLFTDDVLLALQTGRVCEALIAESPQKHLLRSRLCNELWTVLKMIQQPMQAVKAEFPEMYRSAMLSGDIESAVLCRVTYPCACFWTGASSLSSASQNLVGCLKEASKYQQSLVLFMAMAILQCCVHLSGESINEVEMKSMEELRALGEGNAFLEWQVFAHNLASHFYMREYEQVAELSQQYSASHPSQTKPKRTLHIFRNFMEGISVMNLARHTSNNAKYRELGEQAVALMSQLETISTWNFQNKRMLLQAERHYLNRDLISADTAYEASIRSARDHKWLNEEALAYELHGVFCVENGMRDKGTAQLRAAIDRYREWGAANVAKRVQLYVDGLSAAQSKVGDAVAN